MCWDLLSIHMYNIRILHGTTCTLVHCFLFFKKRKKKKSHLNSWKMSISYRELEFPYFLFLFSSIFWKCSLLIGLYCICEMKYRYNNQIMYIILLGIWWILIHRNSAMIFDVIPFLRFVYFFPVQHILHIKRKYYWWMSIFNQLNLMMKNSGNFIAKNS